MEANTEKNEMKKIINPVDGSVLYIQTNTYSDLPNIFTEEGLQLIFNDLSQNGNTESSAIQFSEFSNKTNKHLQLLSSELADLRNDVDKKTTTTNQTLSQVNQTLYYLRLIIIGCLLSIIANIFF